MNRTSNGKSQNHVFTTELGTVRTSPASIKEMYQFRVCHYSLGSTKPQVARLLSLFIPSEDSCELIVFATSPFNENVAYGYKSCYLRIKSKTTYAQ